MNPQSVEKDVHELAVRRAACDGPLVLDVREPAEFAWCRLPASMLIPLGDLPARLGELDREAEIVAICHTGVRSLEAADFLRTQGFARAYSLAGGIHRWSLLIDSSVPTY
jgi:rhodanese-related sulfurtransferase